METFHLIRNVALCVLLFLTACETLAPSRREAPPEVQAQAQTLYDQAQALLNQGQLDAAYNQFYSLSTQYPNTRVADNALLRCAQIQMRQNQNAQAQTLLTELTKSYPQSDVRSAAYRDLLTLQSQQADCEGLLDSVLNLNLSDLSVQDQAKISSHVQNCYRAHPEDTRYGLAWRIQKSKTMDATHPLYQQTREKIIALIEKEDNKAFLEKVVERYPKEFPSGYIAYELTQRYQQEDRTRAMQSWSAYFLENFPMHPKMQNVFDLSQMYEKADTANVQKIGVLLPLSGERETLGQLVLNGLTLALGTFVDDQANHPFELIIEDTQSDPSIAREKAKNLIYKHHVVAIVGPLSADETENIADLAQQFDLPVLSMSTKENLTQMGQTLFRNSLTKKEQAIALAQLTNGILGIHRMAILYPETAYGKEFMQIFWKEFEKYGGKIHGAEGYEEEATDFSKPIKRLVGLSPIELRRGEICGPANSKKWELHKKKGLELPACYPLEYLPPIVDFEAIFIPDHYSKARLILPALKYHDVRGVQVLGTNLWDNKKLLQDNIGQDLEGAIFTDSFFIKNQAPHVQKFMQTFYTHYGYEPSILEAQSYDSLRFLMDQLQKNNPKSRKKLVKALLNKNTNFQGVTGFTGFASSREALRTLSILTVHQNEIVELR
jgi:ABC-type branched-subunit amino acid transport system substrate-binding protein